MSYQSFPEDLRDFFFFLVGIKGTGMAALAEILLARGARVEGCDVEERFYTDEILEDLRIKVFTGFDASLLPAGTNGVVFSSAYSPHTQEVLREARDRGLPLWEYTEALGALSEKTPAAGVAGVHGKTTTTGIAGSLVKALGLPYTVLAGSAVADFGNRSTLIQGEEGLIAETCEYRRHFLRFHPDVILLTSVEADHLDYFSGYDDILDAFVEYVRGLPPGGKLIYCASQDGAVETAERLRKERSDLEFIPYGFNAPGAYGIEAVRREEGEQFFRLPCWAGEFCLRIPGRHTVENAAGALALVAVMTEKTLGRPLGAQDWETLAGGIRAFRGSRRRSEILGEAGGILFMDDYAHHPSAIRTTLKGLKEFYPRRRLVVDFMSHTYSRTAGLFDEFSESFGDADLVILHKIYGSARENQGEGETVSGEKLYQAVRKLHPRVYYTGEPAEAEPLCREILKPGDLFLTMGAGNNWTLGRRLYEEGKLRENNL